MDFARKQLEKYGWTEGKGLGLNENGISKALTPKLKFDNAGIGHEVGDQFTNNWWERVFNSASKNIDVSVSSEEVKLQLKSNESVEISTKSYSLKELKKNNNLEYGSFLKTSKLTESGVKDYKVTPPEPVAAFIALTDDELFAACEGRTAHKGARHGLKLSGKLLRIEKQEKMLLKKMKNVSLSDDATNIAKKMKKLKKYKEDDRSVIMQESEVTSTSSTKKKSKNKRKSVTFNEEPVVKYYTPDVDTSHDSSKDENSNSPVLVDPNSNICDEGIEQDIEDNNSEQSDTHKSFEEAQRTFKDLSKAERKKLKKKRKMAKEKTATVQFIEEVREQIAFEESGKKRKMVGDDADIESKQNQFFQYSKKKKFVVPEISVNHKEKKMMKLVASMDSLCRISDDDMK